MRKTQLVWPLGFGLAVDPVEPTQRPSIGDYSAHNIARTIRAGQPCASNTRPCSEPRKLLYAAVGATVVGPIELQVHLPDPYDLDTQQIVTLDTGTEQCRVALLRHVSQVARRRNLHRLTDWFDAAGIEVLVDKCLHDLKRRSSSPERKTHSLGAGPRPPCVIHALLTPAP